MSYIVQVEFLERSPAMSCVSETEATAVVPSGLRRGGEYEEVKFTEMCWQDARNL